MKSWKRRLAGFLAFVLWMGTMVSVLPPLTVYGASVVSQNNLWKGGPELIFGHSRHYLYQWKLGSGGSSLFCIEQNKKMNTGTTVTGVEYHIGEDMPYVEAKRQFEVLALVCDWFENQGGRSGTRYAVAQSGVWACMNGYYNHLEDAREEIERIAKHIEGDYLGEWKLLTEYVEGTNSGYPSWCSDSEATAPVRNMTLEDGRYLLRLDISKYPQLAHAVWKFPEDSQGWSLQVTGTTLMFSYSGEETPPTGIISADIPQALAGLQKKQSALTVYTSGDTRNQTLISGSQTSGGKLYIKIGGSVEGDVLKLYSHKETFEAHYKVELEKVCSETGNPLAGTVFDVLESFDAGQLGDGTDGSVGRAAMYPSPATWSGFRVCGQMITDSKGKAEHTDTRYYEYEKTYCDGHPEPNYVEIPEVDPETGEGSEEAEAAEAENERLLELWQSYVDACSALEDEGEHFHEIEQGEARERMKEDRDATYESFIQLQYAYTVKETNASYGYILHGLHNDDEAVEVVITNASEAGALTSIEAETEISVQNEEESNLTGGLRGIGRYWMPGTFSYTLPAQELEKSLEELRVVEGAGLTAVVGTPSDGNQAATVSDAVRKASESDAEDREDIGLESFAEVTYTLLPRAAVFEEDEDAKEESWVEVRLPVPEEDDEEPADKKDAKILSHRFHVEDHRTEGELHINKRDMELYQADSSEHAQDSYGKMQGDATLEGAVYGLYAKKDILHPDQTTGVVFAAGDLVAIASTDIRGDASFLVITEVNDTSAAAANRDGTWIGHPLLMGSYEIREISRSEGYELSVYGLELTESNRQGTGVSVLQKAGSAVAGEMSHRIDCQDGSWNDFCVSSFKTEDGYDLIVYGYPEGSHFYKVTDETEEKTELIVIGTQWIQKQDTAGKLVYETALGGEYKLDRQGNYIPLLDDEGKIVYDKNNPITERYYVNYRLGWYPSGTAMPDVDEEKWQDTLGVDESYVAEETNSMLAQMGYKRLSGTDGVPWINVPLSSGTNADLVTELLDWAAEHDFWDGITVEAVYESEGSWYARLLYDYTALKTNAVYDQRHQMLYIYREFTAEDGSLHHIYVPSTHKAALQGFYASATGVPIYPDPIPLDGQIEEYGSVQYEPQYDTYKAGELLLDKSGQPIPVMEQIEVYGDVSQEYQAERLEAVAAVYDRSDGSYRIRCENTIDWGNETDIVKTIFRAQAPETSILVDGREMAYADYLVQIKGAAATAIAGRMEVEAGSYVKLKTLVYPGQRTLYQDGGTREQPEIVLQRVIKQAVEVTKDISQDSYTWNNTYKIHKDPFTVLFGGYAGKGKKYVSGFVFKLYRVRDLAETGNLKINDDGSYDYKQFFSEPENQLLWDTLAVKWDKPSKDIDGDLTTLSAVEGNGAEAYYGRSIMLPYGTYVIVEQIPDGLVNKHYELDAPKEVEIPYVPQINPDGSVQENPSPEYVYFANDTPEELMAQFYIRFNEEDHVIHAHNRDGDFEVYKYGLTKKLLPEHYGNEKVAEYYAWTSSSESKGVEDHVYYQIRFDKDKNVVGYGETLNQVPVMNGISKAVDSAYAKALVPWSVLDPRKGDVINDNGDIGNREPGLDRDGSFNFVAFAKKHFENTFYSSKLRIVKLDSETKENIIHDGAIFKIYAAARDVSGAGAEGAEGSGDVLYRRETVYGTRTALEARGDVENITWNRERQTYEGVVRSPVYDEAEQIYLIDHTGNETGIFKAFSTEREITLEDGTTHKEQVGYIETYEPLGAGAYVLVEVQAPKGYQKSRPVAFEIYRDKITYYREGEQTQKTEAARYQYAQPVAASVYEDMAQIPVTDYPSRMYIHKVEDGDWAVGDENRLDGLKGINDKGDTLSYLVKGRKEYLEARGDVTNIYWNNTEKIYMGTVTKAYDTWSETLIPGTEGDLLAMENVKPLYDVETEAFSGYGIRFDIQVSGAGLCLYQGLEAVRLQDGHLKGVSVIREHGMVTEVLASDTGTHLEITSTSKDTKPPYLKIWDTQEKDNSRCPIFFYDMNKVKTESDDITGETWVLDEGGRRVCCVLPDTGIAYVYDDYGRMILYQADENGNKAVARSVVIQDNGEQKSLYLSLDSVKDSLGLPLYYTKREMEYQDECWISDGSAHEISRLPFGAYILEETRVPEHQGYLTASAMGLILQESSREQHFYYQNDFTKINIGKIDITTGGEVKDAGMTLYCAEKVEDDSEKGWHLEKREAYEAWSSGSVHWMDHVPAGYYILEETQTPFEWGYVTADSIEVFVQRDGNVQTFVMEDDYTSLEIKKSDEKTGEVLDTEHQATLSLYRPLLDDKGKPVIKMTRDIPGREIPVYLPDSRIVTWNTEDGTEVAATGREVTDEYGKTGMVYDYKVHSLPETEEIKQARYYITENGTTRFDYLPPGYYVLVEEETPTGYATAMPMLIEVKAWGHKEVIQKYEMKDIPLTIQVSKADIAGGSREVKGALLSIYSVTEGQTSEKPLYQWISGEGAHTIEYIPAGEYILREENTPYGFAQSEEIAFTVMDTGEIQGVQMVDDIPSGLLKLEKYDEADTHIGLNGAVFELRNQTLDTVVERVTTDADGHAGFHLVPIGRMEEDGSFAPYTYTISEIHAPDDYMLSPGVHEFQFVYEDEHTPVIEYLYQASNRANQVKISKMDLVTQKELPGAKMMVVGKYTKNIVDEWVSTAQPHYINGILEGEYTLIEIAAPGAGYALAESVDFTVEKDMVEVLSVTMYDRPTETVIEKLDGKTDKNLPGARLRLSKITDREEKIIEEWTTTEEPHRITGLVPGRYVISELEAPKGYKKGAPEEIIVKEDFAPQLFEYRNYKLSTGGGSDKEYIAFKKTDIAGVRLAGAEFTFYRLDGSILATAVSDRDGTVRLERPAPGTYLIQETKAPEGYYMSSQVFYITIDEQGVISGDYNLVNTPWANVEIRKYDGDTMGVLAGAVLEIYDEDGELVADGTTGTDGTMKFRAPHPGTYIIREIKAPEGYEISREEWRFIVEEDGTIIGNTTIYNFKAAEKLGLVMAAYSSRIDGVLVPGFGSPGRRIPGARTGDDTPYKLYMYLGAGCIACFVILMMRVRAAVRAERRKDEEDKEQV